MKGVFLADIVDPNRNNFTFIRLLAALAVVISHGVFLISGQKSDEIFAGTSVYTLGDHAVNVFFVLSGLTVAASLSRSPDISRFFVARLLRIFPGLTVCTILLVALGTVISECNFSTYLADARVWKFVAKTIALTTAAAPLPDVFAHNPHPIVINASLWTLKFEVVCYVLLGILAIFKLFDSKKLAVVLPVSWLVAGLFLLYRSGGYPDSLEQFARFWLSFSFGVGLFAFRTHVRVSWAIGLVAAGVVWIVLGTGLERILAPIAAGYVALLLGRLPLGPIRRFTNRVDLSYGVYIFGWPVSQTLIVFMPHISAAALILETSTIAIALAILSWHCVERPALRARDYLSDIVRARLVSWPLFIRSSAA